MFWAEATFQYYIASRYNQWEFYRERGLGFRAAERHNPGNFMAAILKEEYEALAAFRRRIRQFLRFSEDAARAAGLTPQQHQALLAIKGCPGREHVTISELAECLHIRHQSAVGLADRLSINKFARRRPDPADRRRVHLLLTARGRKALEALSAAHREQLSRIGPEIVSLLKHLT
jgi:DNA-binding MarR family transcriptional regulator